MRLATGPVFATVVLLEWVESILPLTFKGSDNYEAHLDGNDGSAVTFSAPSFAGEEKKDKKDDKKKSEKGK